MRDLGTPVYSRALLRAGAVDVSRDRDASASSTTATARSPARSRSSHRDVLEVPWASSLREYRSQCPNNLLYWQHHRARHRHAAMPSLDFGRSTPNEGTYHFKEQWGAQPEPLYWEYVMRGRAASCRT